MAVYRQLEATMLHVNGTHSSSQSTNARCQSPDLSRHISYLLLQGQLFQDINTPTTPSLTTAATRSRFYCEAETQKLIKPFKFRSSSPKTVVCGTAASLLIATTHNLLQTLHPLKDGLVQFVQQVTKGIYTCSLTVMNDTLQGDFVCILLNHNQKTS